MATSHSKNGQSAELIKVSQVKPGVQHHHSQEGFFCIQWISMTLVLGDLSDLHHLSTERCGEEVYARGEFF